MSRPSVYRSQATCWLQTRSTRESWTYPKNVPSGAFQKLRCIQRSRFLDDRCRSVFPVGIERLRGMCRSILAAHPSALNRLAGEASTHHVHSWSFPWLHRSMATTSHFQLCTSQLYLPTNPSLAFVLDGYRLTTAWIHSLRDFWAKAHIRCGSSGLIVCVCENRQRRSTISWKTSVDNRPVPPKDLSIATVDLP